MTSGRTADQSFQELLDCSSAGSSDTLSTAGTAHRRTGNSSSFHSPSCAGDSKGRITSSATIVVGASLAKPKSRIFARFALGYQHADDEDYRDVADGLWACDHNTITPLCLGLYKASSAERRMTSHVGPWVGNSTTPMGSVITRAAALHIDAYPLACFP